MQYAAVNAGASGLNVRVGRSTLWCPFTVLKTGTVVTVIDGPTADGWYKIASPVVGWCYGPYLTFNRPPPVLSGATKLGLHFGSGGAGIWNTIAGPIPSMQCATIIDSDCKFANSLVGRVKYLVFRYYGQGGDTPAIPANPVDAAQFAVNWLAERWSVFAQLEPRIYIQVVNECTYQPSHVAFWDTIASRLKARGYRAAIGAYAPANLEMNEWAALAPMLLSHQADGHIFVSHIYSQAGTPPGNLSADIADYEGRPLRWYASTPEITMPFLSSETGNEWTRGKNVGAEATISFAKKYLALYKDKPWFGGGMLWDLDNVTWADANIQADVPELVKQGVIG